MKKQREKAVIIFAIQSLQDPLFQGLMYQYIQNYNRQEKERVKFYVLTEEHERYQMESEAQAKLQKELEKQDIYWNPLKYRGGRFIVLKKIYSVLGFFWKVWAIKRKHKVNTILGFLVMAGAYSYIVSRLLRMNLIIFCYEPHSEYMIDFGTWSRSSFKYKILSYLERKEAQKADFITGPTRHSMQLLKALRAEGKMYSVPISVDTEKFKFNPVMRKQLRHQYQVPPDRCAILYLGKFRGIYYNEKEVAAFCKRLVEAYPKFFIFTITPNPIEEIKTAYLEAGLKETDFVLLKEIPYRTIDAYISACDIGLVAIPPLPSQKYRTPVKIGNYLSCGLPYIVTRGIADDDDLAEQKKIGVVYDSLDEKDFDLPLAQLLDLVKEDKAQQRERCRKIAIERRGIHNSVNALRDIFTQLFE